MTDRERTCLERVHGDLFRVWSDDAWVDETAKVLPLLVLLHELHTRSTWFRVCVTPGRGFCQYLCCGSSHRGSSDAAEWPIQGLQIVLGTSKIRLQ